MTILLIYRKQNNFNYYELCKRASEHMYCPIICHLLYFGKCFHRYVVFGHYPLTNRNGTCVKMNYDFNSCKTVFLKILTVLKGLITYNDDLKVLQKTILCHTLKSSLWFHIQLHTHYPYQLGSDQNTSNHSLCGQ